MVVTFRIVQARVGQRTAGCGIRDVTPSWTLPFWPSPDQLTFAFAVLESYKPCT